MRHVLDIPLILPNAPQTHRTNLTFNVCMRSCFNRTLTINCSALEMRSCWVKSAGTSGIQSEGKPGSAAVVFAGVWADVPLAADSCPVYTLADAFKNETGLTVNALG